MTNAEKLEQKQAKLKAKERKERIDYIKNALAIGVGAISIALMLIMLIILIFDCKGIMR